MKKLIFFFLLFSFKALSALPLDNTLFSKFISQLDRKKASFEQIKYIPELEMSFTSTGNIFFHKGVGVSFQQKEPEELTFTATKTTYCVQNEKKDLKELPYFEQIAEWTDAIMSENWDKLEELFNLHYSQTKTDWYIELTPTEQHIAEFIEKINFTGTPTDLIKIELIYANGTKITMILSSTLKDPTDEINC